jgi:hypothetical protein
MPARPHPAYLSAWRLLLEAHATVTELLEHELVAECSQQHPNNALDNDCAPANP